MNLGDPNVNEEAIYDRDGKIVNNWSWGALRTLSYAGYPLAMGVIFGVGEAILDFQATGNIDSMKAREAAAAGTALGLVMAKMQDYVINTELIGSRREAQARKRDDDSRTRLGMEPKHRK